MGMLGWKSEDASDWDWGGIIYVSCCIFVMIKRTIRFRTEHRKRIVCRRPSDTWERDLKLLPKHIVADCICPFLDLCVGISFRRSRYEKDVVKTENENVIKALYGRTDYRSANPEEEVEYYVYFRRVYFRCDCIRSLDFKKILHSLPNAELTSLSLDIELFNRGCDIVSRRCWKRLIEQFIESLQNLHELRLPSLGCKLDRTHIYFPLINNTSILPKLRVVYLGNWSSYSVPGPACRNWSTEPYIKYGQGLVLSLTKARIGTISEIYFSTMGPRTGDDLRHMRCNIMNYRLKFVRGEFVELRRTHPRCNREHGSNSPILMDYFVNFFNYRTLFDEIGFPTTMYFENWVPNPIERQYCRENCIACEFTGYTCQPSYEHYI